MTKWYQYFREQSAPDQTRKILPQITNKSFPTYEENSQMQAGSREIYLFILAQTDYEKMFLEV